MKSRSLFMLFILFSVALLQIGWWGRSRGQYDVEAQEMEKTTSRQIKASNPAKGIAKGVKEVAVESPAGFVAETAEKTAETGPVLGTIEGARQGTGVVLDKTVKGAVRVATLGQGSLDHYEVREPEAGSGEPTKITIKIPGT